MDRALRVLLIEDEPAECTAIMDYIDTVTDVTIVECTNNAETALKHVQDYKPDAIILDLELHKGSGNGIFFLEELKKLSLGLKPFILVTTNNSSIITHNYIRTVGTDFILCKFENGYNAQSVVNLLQSMQNAIISRSQTDGLPIELATTESLVELKKRINTRICSELNLVGISPKALGYQYLIDAITIGISGHCSNIPLMISEKYKKSEASVARAMQNCINNAWRSQDIESLETYYTARVNPKRGAPSVTEFIFHYAERVKPGQ